MTATRIKKLYKVDLMATIVDLDKHETNFEPTRSVEVAAIDVSQAIRKAKYSLTKKGQPIQPHEFIDAVTRLGVIEVK